MTRILRSVLDSSCKPLSVIEIGTAYGDHLYQLYGCDNLKEIVSIDPMYDWVPDVKPDESFDEKLVNRTKINRWVENAKGIPATLIISKSHDAALSNSLPHHEFDVLVIDGCHHPANAVEDDYWDFVQYLKSDHIVIFDDINHSDPRIAADAVLNRLADDGATATSEDLEGNRVRVITVSQLTK